MSDLVLIFLVILLFVACGVCVVLAGFGLAFLTGAPYVGTPKKIAKDMLAFAELQPGEVCMDIGSGSGTLLFVAAREFGAERAIGYEINPFLVWWTRARAVFLGFSKKIHVRRANFFSVPIERADVVALYLLPGAMRRLCPRLHRALPLGTRIVSRGFAFEHIEPDRVKKHQGTTLYLYILKE